MFSLFRIGLDVGGVLTDSLANDNSDTSFRGDNFLETSPVPGAVEAVRTYVTIFGRENVFIVSKCGAVIEHKTRLWLPRWGVVGDDMIDPANVHFCLRREDKAPIAQMLGLTHFFDDRPDVLAYMEGKVPNRFLFGEQNDEAVPPGMFAVPNWRHPLSHFIINPHP